MGKRGTLLLLLGGVTLAAVLVVLSWGQGRAPQVHAQNENGPADGTANINFNNPPAKVLSQCVFIDRKTEPKNPDPRAPKVQVGYACDGLAAGQATPGSASKPLTTDADLDASKDGNIVLVLAADGYSFEIDKGVVDAKNRELSSPNRVHCDLLNSEECFVKFSFAVPVGGISVDPDLGGLALETAQSSGGNEALLAGVIAGISAVAIMLTGAAWYARRRWLA